MKISQIEERLRIELRRRIERGQESVSRLSRKTGLGQSHISNFLRGKRLSVVSFDRMLEGMELGVEKLVGSDREVPGPDRVADFLRIPLVSQATAMWEAQPARAAIKRMISVPARDVLRLAFAGTPGRLTWRRFVAIELSASDAAGMEPVVYPGSVLVLDRRYNSLKSYEKPEKKEEAAAGTKRKRINLYLAREGTKLVVRYAYFNAKRLVLKPYQGRYLTTFVEVDSRLAAMELLAGRVAYLWSEFEGMVIEVDDLEEDRG